MTAANKKKRTLALTGAATLIAGCFLLGAYLLAPSGYLALDVNPSVEIRTNRLNQITSVTGANEDGKKLLEGYDPAGEDLDDVVEDIVDRMALGGYLTADTANQVLVTADSGSIPAKTLESVNQKIERYIDGRSLKAQVLTQQIEISEALLKQAESHQVSAGKMRIIGQLAADGTTLSPQDLADISIQDLLAYAGKEGVTLRQLENQLDRMDDVYDDEPVLEDLEDALEKARKTAATPKPTATPAATPKPQAKAGSESPQATPRPHIPYNNYDHDDWDDIYDRDDDPDDIYDRDDDPDDIYDHDDDPDDIYDHDDDWDDIYDRDDDPDDIYDHDDDWDDIYDHDD